MAAGLTEQDALAAAEKLWASSRNGAVSAQAAIDEIKRILEGGAVAAGQLAANIDSAFSDRSMHIGITMDDLPTSHGMGFATGSSGIRDFGSGTPVMLHGRERVQTEAQMQSEQSGGNVAGRLDRIERVLADLPRAITIGFADALVLQGVR
jgi:hypothetical protein